MSFTHYLATIMSSDEDFDTRQKSRKLTDQKRKLYEDLIQLVIDSVEKEIGIYHIKTECESDELNQNIVTQATIEYHKNSSESEDDIQIAPRLTNRKKLIKVQQTL